MWEKLKSRKLWMAVLSVSALALMAITHQMPVQDAVQAAGKIVLVYLVAQGAVDTAAGMNPQK